VCSAHSVSVGSCKSKHDASSFLASQESTRCHEQTTFFADTPREYEKRCGEPTRLNKCKTSINLRQNPALARSLMYARYTNFSSLPQVLWPLTRKTAENVSASEKSLNSQPRSIVTLATRTKKKN
jgi:hypothetical protein